MTYIVQMRIRLESFFVDEEDVEVCWKAVEEVRKCVMAYCDLHPIEKSPLE